MDGFHQIKYSHGLPTDMYLKVSVQLTRIESMGIITFSNSLQVGWLEFGQKFNDRIFVLFGKCGEEIWSDPNAVGPHPSNLFIWTVLECVSYLCIIRITCLCVNAIVVLDVLEGIIHESSFAAVVAISPGTVHQVLLTQGNKLSSFFEVLAFQGTSLEENNKGSSTFGLKLLLWQRNRSVGISFFKLSVHLTCHQERVSVAIFGYLIKQNYTHWLLYLSCKQTSTRFGFGVRLWE